MGDPHRYCRLLFFAVLALALALYILTNVDVLTWMRWVFERCSKGSQCLIHALFRESASDTNSNDRSTHPTGTIAQSQLSLPGDFITTPAMTAATTQMAFPPLRSPEMYVRSAYMGTGQLGNSMFEYISSYVAARRLGLKFVVTADGSQLQAYRQMSSLFKISAPLYNGHFPAERNVGEEGWGIYTPAVTKLESYGSYTQIVGWLQSWRYLAGCEQFVQKEFALTDRYKLFVNEFFSKYDISLIAGDQKNATLIAIHIRRGDMLRHLDQYQMASPQYLVQAIAYFRDKYAAQQPTFVVATDDKPWTRTIVDGALQNSSVRVIYSSGTAEEDMAVLSSCHHAIITGGTYGWWIAWLTGGNVMYFRDFMWKGSIEWRNYKAEDYYPPPWIGRT